MYTQLFRADVQIPLALHHTFERNPDADSMMSVPSSIGAEQDTVLGILTKSGIDRPIKSKGYDINPDAKRHAQLGQYALSGAANVTLDLYKLLEEYGFTIGTQSRVNSTLGRTSVNRVSSVSLRRPHKVSFETHDLSTEIPTEEKADLVIASNMFYHLQPVEAWRALKNIANLVSNRGVLNISGLAQNPDRRMGIKTSSFIMRYGDWLDTSIYYLGSTFGLLPIPGTNNESGTPTMFARE